MALRLSLLPVPLLLSACGVEKHDGDDEGGTSDGGSGEGDGGWTDETVMDCRWGGGGLEVILVYGAEGGYDFGMAETGAVADPWTGEDCYRGYTSGDGVSVGFCHFLSPSGGFLQTVKAVEDVVDGATTLHSEWIENTYLLAEADSGRCWVFGHDIGYFEGLGCTDIGPPCAGE